MMPSGSTRRSFLVGGTAGLCLATLSDMAAAAATPLTMQLGWLGSGNQLGEVCALRLGYFEQEGLDFKIQPGGPNNDGIAVVASGRYEVGQVSLRRPQLPARRRCRTAAFDTALNVARGKNIDEALLQAARDRLPGGPVARA